eukprot:jgi/Astpho2/9675/fgenesh1_pg.00146_%23_81_t
MPYVFPAASFAEAVHCSTTLQLPQRLASSRRPLCRGHPALFRSITKFVGLVFLTHCLVTYEEMPQLVKELMYAVALYCLLGCLMDFPATVAISTTGLAISPHFDQPYASESMASFWGRRWNVATSNTLRSLIYDPIYEGRLVRSSRAANAYSPIRRAVGLCACFIVSGMVHELIYWYLMGFVTGKWQIFFTMQGPAVVLETAVRKWLKARSPALPPLKAPSALHYDSVGADVKGGPGDAVFSKDSGTADKVNTLR